MPTTRLDVDWGLRPVVASVTEIEPVARWPCRTGQQCRGEVQAENSKDAAPMAKA
jgi:hypothetical protein